MKVETYLPVFPGFYGTIFEIRGEEEEIEYINEERKERGLKPISFNDCVFDYKEPMENTAKAACNWTERELIDLGIIKSITYQKIVSPREYNFTNDTIDIEVDFKMHKLKAYLIENFEEFSKYIKEKYTSCSGFISSHPNDAQDWIDYHIDEKLEHCIGSCLNFILFNEDDECEMSMYEHCLENNVGAILTNYDELLITEV